MVSDAELDRWEDQPHKINLAAIREVCRELMKRRELDAEVMIALTGFFVGFVRVVRAVSAKRAAKPPVWCKKSLI